VLQEYASDGELRGEEVQARPSTCSRVELHSVSTYMGKEKQYRYTLFIVVTRDRVLFVANINPNQIWRDLAGSRLNIAPGPERAQMFAVTHSCTDAHGRMTDLRKMEMGLEMRNEVQSPWHYPPGWVQMPSVIAMKEKAAQ
jgi:hypothetical protein